MSVSENRSSRHAIQRWLRKTDSQSKHSPDEIRAHSATNDGYCSHQQLPQRNSTRHSRSQRPQTHRRNHQRKRESSKEPSKEVRTSHQRAHLADELGLQSPFRAFAHDNDRPEIEHGANHQHRKRRRRSSSFSTSLEPAATIDLTNPDAGAYDVPLNILNRPRANIGSRTRSVPSTSSAGRDKHVREDEQEPAKRYEKRPRHRTREDRYEVKKSKKASEKSAPKDDSPMKVKKRKRKDKSGAAVMHDYRAPNLLHERLTVSFQPPQRLAGNPTHSHSSSSTQIHWAFLVEGRHHLPKSALVSMSVFPV